VDVGTSDGAQGTHTTHHHRLHLVVAANRYTGIQVCPHIPAAEERGVEKGKRVATIRATQGRGERRRGWEEKRGKGTTGCEEQLTRAQASRCNLWASKQMQLVLASNSSTFQPVTWRMRVGAHCNTLKSEDGGTCSSGATLGNMRVPQHEPT
jgi:hypothetical protein